MLLLMCKCDCEYVGCTVKDVNNMCCMRHALMGFNCLDIYFDKKTIQAIDELLVLMLTKLPKTVVRGNRTPGTAMARP